MLHALLVHGEESGLGPEGLEVTVLQRINYVILFKLERLGETIEHYYPEQMAQFSAPVSPMKNIYLPQLLQLVQIKLRVGHAISRNAAKYIRSG